MKFLICYCLVIFTSISAFASKKKEVDSSGKSLDKASLFVDASTKYQTIDGWGGSLCWWANVVGGYSDEKVKAVCDWITDPIDGLNMNIFRFNIGGGDNPKHHHLRKDGGAMPGYKASQNADYDWNSDVNQRRILKQLIASRITKAGKNDIRLVAFANSPPWWMTVSGCVSGTFDGKTCNLREDMYEQFADYLTEITKHYHDVWSITFDHLEPFNEPFSTWWKENGGQEGCYFSQGDQHKMINVLYTSLKNKNMLGYCSVSAMDANSIDEALDGVNGYALCPDLLRKINRLDVHSYFGSKRIELAQWASEHRLPLWQSESGPLSVGGSDEHQMMVVADRIITDLRQLRCSAWIDWQLVADNSPIWGLLVGKYSEEGEYINPGPSYYLRSLFSRYIKVGYTIVKSNLPYAVAALSPDQNELVVTVVNSQPQIKQIKLDAGSWMIKQAKAVSYSTGVYAPVGAVMKTIIPNSPTDKLIEFEVGSCCVTTVVLNRCD